MQINDNRVHFELKNPDDFIYFGISINMHLRSFKKVSAKGVI